MNLEVIRNSGLGRLVIQNNLTFICRCKRPDSLIPFQASGPVNVPTQGISIREFSPSGRYENNVVLDMAFMTLVQIPTIVNEVFALSSNRWKSIPCSRN
jgi:hypothetical protein